MGYDGDGLLSEHVRDKGREGGDTKLKDEHPAFIQEHDQQTDRFMQQLKEAEQKAFRNSGIFIICVIFFSLFLYWSQ